MFGPVIHHYRFAKYDQQGNIIHFDVQEAEKVLNSVTSTKEQKQIAFYMLSAYNLAKKQYQP